MAFLASSVGCDVGLRLLLSPVTSTVITRTACVAVGVGIPMYSTFKAIEERNKIVQKRLLIYWTVYGGFHIIEVFSDKLLAWFPYYHYAKLAFLIWLQLPATMGASHCYDCYLRPLFLKHKVALDYVVDCSIKTLNDAVVTHQPEIQFIKNAAQKLIAAVKETLQGACNAPPLPAIDNAIDTSDDENAEDSQTE